MAGTRVDMIRKEIETIDSELAKVVAEIGRLEEERNSREARRAGLAYELHLLETGTSASSVAELSRTDAILAMLRQRSSQLSPSQLVDALRAAGREREDARSVSATLDYLKKRGLVRSPRRGYWVIAES